MENLPNEMLSMIAKFLPKDALLDCRLLNRNWNSVCLFYLHESCFAVKSYDRMRKLIDILVAPLTVEKLEIRNLILDVDRVSLSDLRIFSKFFGSSIKECTLKVFLFGSEHSYKAIYELLSNLPNIQKLKSAVSCGKREIQIPNPEQYENLYLPKLINLEFLNFPDADFCKYLINASPNLQKLTLISKPYDNKLPEVLSVFSSERDLSLTLKRFWIEDHTLNIPITQVNITDLEIQIGEDFGTRPAQALEKLIQKNSHCLMHLKLTTLHYPKEKAFVEIPSLPNLRILKLKNWTRKMNPEFVNLTADKFRSLKFLKIVGICSDTRICEFLNSFGDTQDLCKLDLVSLNFGLGMSHTVALSFTNFLQSQKQNIRRLKLEYADQKNLIPFPKMKSLEYLNMMQHNLDTIVGRSCQFFSFTSEEFPYLNAVDMDEKMFLGITKFETFRTVNSLKLQRPKKCFFIHNMFPNILKLELDCAGQEYVGYIFENLSKVQELKMKFDSNKRDDKTWWKMLTGESMKETGENNSNSLVSTSIFSRIKKVAKIKISKLRNVQNGNLHIPPDDIPEPNIGSMKVLQSLILEDVPGIVIEALAYMTQDLKLHPLKQLQITYSESSQKGYEHTRTLKSYHKFCKVKPFYQHKKLHQELYSM